MGRQSACKLVALKLGVQRRWNTEKRAGGTVKIYYSDAVNIKGQAIDLQVDDNASTLRGGQNGA